MVLTTSHTISKSKSDEKKIDETIDKLRDSEYFTEYTVNKHGRLHHKPRRQEMARTTTQKAEAKKALVSTKTPIAAKDNKSSFFSSEKFLNLFKKKKYKTPNKCTKKRKGQDGQATQRKIATVESSDLTTTSRRRKRRRNYTLQVHKRYAKPYQALFSTRGKLPPKSSKEFPYHFGLNNHFPKSEAKLAYELPFITETPSTAILLAEPTQEFIGTAELENMLAQIKERAILTLANQPPSISELITTTVTETTFEADPILRHYLPRSSTLRNLFSNYKKQKRNLNSTISALETRNSGSSFTSNVETSACSFEAQLQKEIKELLKIIKEKLFYGLKCVKSTTKQMVHEAKEYIHKATGPNKYFKGVKYSNGSKLQVCLCKNKNSKTTSGKDLAMRNTRNSTTKKHRLFHHHKTTTNTPEQHSVTVDDDYSMLKRFEHVLSKSHENNVMKMVTTPNNVLSYKRNVNKVSKRNQETIEDLNLKENIRKLVDFDTIPDEPDYNKDTSIEAPKKEDDDTKAEALSIDASGADTTSLEGLSKRLSYKEYVDGFKNYLNYVRDTTSSNFSNLVRYQAHRHHKVEDIGKFILDKIPKAVPQMRDKRRFFDDSDGDDQDMSTKSDESWFKRHFYLFIDTGPPKTVSPKHASVTIEHKRGKKTPATTVNDITTEEIKTKLDGDINEMLKILDYTVHSLDSKVKGRFYIFFLGSDKEGPIILQLALLKLFAMMSTLTS